MTARWETRKVLGARIRCIHCGGPIQLRRSISTGKIAVLDADPSPTGTVRAYPDGRFGTITPSFGDPEPVPEDERYRLHRCRKVSYGR